jgi:hypothetical protein
MSQPWSIIASLYVRLVEDPTATSPVGTMINQQISLHYYIKANQTCNFGRYDSFNELSATIFLQMKQGFVPTRAILTTDA